MVHIEEANAGISFIDETAWPVDEETVHFLYKNRPIKRVRDSISGF